MIYAVGDIHGEASALRDLLDKLPLEPSDLIVFLGDAIDRGPDAFGCIEQIVQFARCRKVFIQGNHEEAMLSFLEDGDFNALSGMDVQPTLDSYAAGGWYLNPGDPNSLPLTHLRLYAQAEPWTLPFYITDNYIFTHAGWDLALPLPRQSTSTLRWGKVKGWDEPIWTQIVVRGHTPFPRVTFMRARQQISVDTGCGNGGLLSAVCLPTEQVFTARPLSWKPRR